MVLSDKGVCCIDEFSTIDDDTKAGIHEVMEQQTVSIAKAGIFTSLQARTSILAATNPIFGKYKARLRPHINIGMSPALLSRFDFIFRLVDLPDQQRDLEIARHVLTVHKTLRPPNSGRKNTNDCYTLRLCIQFA